MKKDDYLDTFYIQQKAIDHAIRLNFKYRMAKIKFGIIEHPKGKWAVLEEATSQDMGIPFLDSLSKNYSEMTYDVIRHIKMDSERLPYWEDMLGVFSGMDGELLRFILHTKIPLEKFDSS